MITLFRNIRKRLLSEDRVSRYLFYAFGEILLVVVGILLALFINNWNQERLEKIEELKSLQFLKAEFAGNLEKFDHNNKLQVDRLKAIKDILFNDLSNANIHEIDSLYKLTFYSWTYNPSFSTYNSLVSSGKMNLFSDDSLKIRLSSFKDLVIDYQEDEVNLYDYSKEHIFSQEIEHSGMLSETKFNLRSRTHSEEMEDKMNYLKHFKNPEFRNQLTIATLHLELILGEGVKLRKELIDLHQKINDNLGD